MEERVPEQRQGLSQVRVGTAPEDWGARVRLSGDCPWVNNVEPLKAKMFIEAHFSKAQ